MERDSMVTEGIRVSVRSKFVPEESSARHMHFVFAYEIEIVNESQYKVQLMKRTWSIVDGLGQKREVHGDGVIGHQPILAPGDEFRYVSGCHFHTTVGRMSGLYHFIKLPEKTPFDVKIPAFSMILPALDN
ncbi:MAG: Co2+/Mg2+ efflux protein ApaG [Bacteroidia bacterium]